jgi:hypothetical protein
VRTGVFVNQSKLSFAGKVMDTGIISNYELKQETTIHMNELPKPKPITVNVEFDEVTREVSIPNEPGIIIRDVKRYSENAHFDF